MDRDTVEEIKRHFGVVAEGLRDDIRAVAEGQALLAEKQDLLAEKQDQLSGKQDQLVTEVKTMIRLSHGQLRDRVERLENRG